MVANYNFDYILIGLLLIISIVGIVHIFVHGQKLNNYKYAIPFMLGGLLIIVISSIGNSFFENKWGNEYVVAFLLLKKVSSGWFFRHLCSWGYIFFLWGVSMLFVVRLTKK